MRKQIPNFITLANLFSGCIAITMAFQENFIGVVIWVIIAAIFDFFDGFAARMLGVSSKLGVELDSLADVVSFGVAPACALFVLLRERSAYPDLVMPLHTIIPYLAFMIAVFSAYRLAKFNIDDRQTSHFLGLPTPANALFWVSYCYGIRQLSIINENLFYSTLGFLVILSALMISETPLFSFKIKSLKIRGNEKQFLLVVVMIAFVSLWGIIGIAWGILAYIAISIFSEQRAQSE